MKSLKQYTMKSGETVEVLRSPKRFAGDRIITEHQLRVLSTGENEVITASEYWLTDNELKMNVVSA